MKRVLLKNGNITNEGRSFKGSIVIEDEFIQDIIEGVFEDYLANKSSTGEGEAQFLDSFNEIIDCTGKLVIPGIIDDQVHFREPGLTHKGDIFTESRAAIAGGVTTFMEMPNTAPTTSVIHRLNEKFDIAEDKSYSNYSFYFGATNDNIELISQIEPTRICGIKVFMGSSTGDMLVDDEDTLSAIFKESPILVATHCEDEKTIRKNLEYYKEVYKNGASTMLHPIIRSEEACYISSSKAVELATKYNTDLHILHISTKKELELFSNKIPLYQKKITAEVCVHHLTYENSDYYKLENRLKCNPAIKMKEDREALREALRDGRLDIVATDHAPHTIEEKNKDYFDAPAGLPFVGHSLVSMLEFVKNDIFSMELIIDRMVHAPAIRYKIDRRGFLKIGFYADIVVVDLNSPNKIEIENILYKCRWSTLEGVTLNSKIEYTILNGNIAYRNGKVIDKRFAKELKFCRE